MLPDTRPRYTAPWHDRRPRHGSPTRTPTIEVGTETLPARARDPGFGEYEDKTSRTIPVVLLEPRS